ncbi:MAG: protein kinase [Mariniblastus sp.]
MAIQCPNCKTQITSEGREAPRFCSQCGSPLGEHSSDHHLTQTVSPQISPGPSTPFGFGIEDTISHGSNDGNKTKDTLPDGSFVGPFQIIRTLGQGGMGTVYEATHSKTSQTVALKLLSRSVRTTEETIQRFQRESQIAASINHPRSTFVYQAGQHQGQFYITMELMTGGTLTDIVKNAGPVPVARAVDYVLDIISGLQAAHQAGIVHRDLKPANCFVEESGRVKIGDFGLAKSFLSDSSLTQTGTFMGTPQYAAPEQLRSSDVDERADIYAIGGTLFFLLTGRAPFVGNAAQVIASISTDAAPKVDTLVEAPRELSRQIQQTLEKDPARRPENLSELRQSLLPFSTRGATPADFGRRMAAFFLDVFLISLVISFASQCAQVVCQVLFGLSIHDFFLVNVFLVEAIAVGYFVLQEWRWGTTVGKWLLGMRVISQRNQPPSLMAATIRTALVPGLSYLASSLPVYFLEFDPSNYESLLSLWLFMMVVQIVSWVPSALCFVTARKSNGYQGLHDRLSRSSVVRLAGALEYKRPKNVPVTAPVALAESKTLGDYVAIGRIGLRPDSGSEILLARDSSLDRDVWIVNQAAAQPTLDWEKRKAVSRPTRLRILAEHAEPDQTRWVATEAIKGMPLIDFIRQTPDIDWRSFRPLLRELVYELAKGQQDGTLPARLSEQSVWLDQTGRAKLLDQPIRSTAGDNAKPQTDSDESLQQAGQANQWLEPFELIACLLDAFIQDQVVPAHVLTFRKELDVLRADTDALNAAGIRLGDLADEPSAWRWDDRLGVLAISSGLEFSAVLCFGMFLGLACNYLFEMSSTFAAITIFITGSVASILLGIAFGGGPVFRLSGVMLRKNKTLEPASNIRSGFRTWISWFPLILTTSAVTISFQQILLETKTTTIESPETDPAFVIISSLLFFGVVTVIFFAAIYSVWRPSRGLADLISGTRLIRK